MACRGLLAALSRAASKQDDDHILVSIDQRLVAGSEEPKDGVEEEQTDDTQSDTDDEIKRYRVA